MATLRPGATPSIVAPNGRLSDASKWRDRLVLWSEIPKAPDHKRGNQCGTKNAGQYPRQAFTTATRARGLQRGLDGKWPLR